MTIRNHFLGSTILAIALLAGSVFSYFIGSSIDYSPNELTVLGQGFLLAIFAVVAYQARKRQRFIKNNIWLGIEVFAILYIIISFILFIGYATTPCSNFLCRPFLTRAIDYILISEWAIIAPLVIIAYMCVFNSKISHESGT